MKTTRKFLNSRALLKMVIARTTRETLLGAVYDWKTRKGASNGITH